MRSACNKLRSFLLNKFSPVHQEDNTLSSVLGGWELPSHGMTDLKRVRWFSVRVTAQDLPYLSKDGQSTGMSTVAELLASLFALYAFGWMEAPCISHTIYAGTDNLANEHVTRKQATTSSPLYVHMQLSHSLFLKGSHLRLKWRPRELNQPAHDLTSGRFESFCGSLRVHLKLEEVDLSLMEELAKHHDEVLAWKGSRVKATGGGMTKRQKLTAATSAEAWVRFFSPVPDVGARWNNLAKQSTRACMKDWVEVLYNGRF